MSKHVFREELARALATANLAPAPQALDAIADALARHYSEPVRAYHTAAHIAAMLADYLPFERHAQSPAAVTLAILYHDVIYDPQRSDNEAASAAFAATALRGLGAPAALTARITDLIVATKHGATNPDPADRDCALLLDLDLAVLGGTPAAYRAYADAIRIEYAHVPDAAYRAGRAHVLKQFLAAPHIYRTDEFRARLDVRARENLAKEIAQLEHG